MKVAALRPETKRKRRLRRRPVAASTARQVRQVAFPTSKLSIDVLPSARTFGIGNSARKGATAPPPVQKHGEQRDVILQKRDERKARERQRREAASLSKLGFHTGRSWSPRLLDEDDDDVGWVLVG